MLDHLKEFLKVLKEQEKEYVINLSDPEDLYRFELRWKLMHERMANFDERFLRGARILIEHLDSHPPQD